MSTILRVALGTIFPKENIDSILEVISATPNPDVATEILLGVYTPPFVKSAVMLHDKESFFKSFDKWENRVNYEYKINDTARIHVPQGTDKALITESNYKEFAVPYKSDDSVFSVDVKLSVLKTVCHYTDLENWNSRPEVEFPVHEA